MGSDGLEMGGFVLCLLCVDVVFHICVRAGIWCVRLCLFPPVFGIMKNVL